MNVINEPWDDPHDHPHVWHETERWCLRCGAREMKTTVLTRLTREEHVVTIEAAVLTDDVFVMRDREVMKTFDRKTLKAARQFAGHLYASRGLHYRCSHDREG